MGMMAAGRRNKRIVIERLDAGLDEFGHLTVDAEWKRRGKFWAGIVYGPGAEQRAAAQQGGSQTATFFVPLSTESRATSVKDRIRYPIYEPDPKDWPAWEIAAVAEVDRNGIVEGLAFTATRVAA